MNQSQGPEPLLRAHANDASAVRHTMPPPPFRAQCTALKTSAVAAHFVLAVAGNCMTSMRKA